jgi:excisionase family DNA binding protein
MATDQLLTVVQVAERLQLHPETIRRWVREGKLPAVKLGSDRAGFRIRESDVRRLTAHA